MRIFNISLCFYTLALAISVSGAIGSDAVKSSQRGLSNLLSKLSKEVTSRIKHVVVLMEENRSFDHFFGYAAKLLGVNGVQGNETQLKNLRNPSKGSVHIDSNSPYCGLCDPDHGTPATYEKVYGLGNASAGDPATMSGFVAFENAKGREHLNWCGVMSMFPPERLPIITTLAQEFAIMDRFFCSHPGTSTKLIQLCLYFQQNTPFFDFTTHKVQANE